MEFDNCYLMPIIRSTNAASHEYSFMAFIPKITCKNCRSLSSVFLRVNNIQFPINPGILKIQEF